MRVIYMGKDKPSAVEGLRWLVEEGIEVVAVVAPMGEAERPGVRLAEVARELGIRVRSAEELYAALSEPEPETEPEDEVGRFDLVVSFLYWKRIRRPLIELPEIGCVNFHPAPLPDFRGLGGYNIAILEGLDEWGVSAHFVEETFDTGDVIEVRRFGIDPQRETAYSLEQKSQGHLLELFRSVVRTARRDGRLEGTPQGEGRYITREEFERMRRIRPEDSAEEIERRIRAFWYPPYRGATIEVDGREYTLVSDRLLEEIAERYHGE